MKGKERSARELGIRSCRLERSLIQTGANVAYFVREECRKYRRKFRVVLNRRGLAFSDPRNMDVREKRDFIDMVSRT